MAAYSAEHDTIDLIRMGKEGDEHALNTLFARYHKRVLRIVRLRLNLGMRERLRVQSIDILQEVFLNAFKNLSGFEPTSEGSFIHWLSRIVENVIRDQLDFASASKRNPPGGLTSLDKTINVSEDELHLRNIITSGLNQTSPYTSPTHRVWKQDAKNIVDDLLLKLDESDQEVIIQHKLVELTFSEIGSLLGKSEDAVRKHFHRAFAKLVSIAEDNKALKELRS